jgi:predicted aminopeptidase
MKKYLSASWLLLTLSSGCAKLGYLTEQGVEQVKLQWNGQPNEQLLADGKVPDKVKHKLRLVAEYKSHFYNYFAEKPTSIYSKTTMLKHDAVTYLLIASPRTKIEAHQFHFPLMGSFPYLGFFKQQSALDFAQRLQEQERLVTWIRPVYAYSTLGYMEDRILSSFFEYGDIELAELIFHELFHTVFFIRDEVDLNENLANFYGKELMKEYFQGRPELNHYLEREKKKELISQRVVSLIQILKDEFSKLGAFITDEKADALTTQFVAEVFLPELLTLREQLGLSEADYRLNRQWNQASFAAFLTYEEKQDFLDQLKNDRNLNLKDYLTWLRMEYQDFSRQKPKISFADYLKMKVPHAPLALDRSP